MIVSPRGRARQGRVRNDSLVEQLSAGTVLRAGNDPERVIAPLVQAFPDMGFPRAANAIRIMGEHLRDQERGQE